MSRTLLAMLVVGAIGTMGCSDGKMLMPFLARDITPTGTVILRVQGAGRYFIGNELVPFSEESLEERLKAALPAGGSNPAIQVRLYPGATPYYAEHAINIAARLGFVTASAIDGYTDDTSIAAQMKWKVYDEIDISARGAQARKQIAEGYRDRPIRARVH